MTPDDYISSEQFIADDLELRAKKIADILYEQLPALIKAKTPMDRFIITWPAVAIKTDDGTPLEAPCLTRLQEQHDIHYVLPQVIARTQAYAFLYADTTLEQPSVHLESHHGTVTWTMKSQYRGDRWALSAPTLTRNTRSFELLWRKKAAKV